jgi:opacity protein-like surface antigen
MSGKVFSAQLLRFFSVRGLALILMLLGMASLAFAQNEQGWSTRFSGGVGGGYTPLVGSVSNKLHDGWNIRVGAGYKFSRHFSTDISYSYHGLGVSSSVLREAQVPGGNAHVWSVTADPRIRFSPGRGIDPYLVGTFGYYRRVVQFTQPTLQPVVIFDPFFGFFQGAVPANQVLGSIQRSGIGGGAGAGFEFGLGSWAASAKLFTEARYEYASTGALPTRMIPITVGIRF